MRPITEAVPWPGVSSSHPVRAARACVASDHRDVIAAIDDCADATAATWPRDRVADRAAVVDPLRTELEAAGILERLPSVLSDAVAATGYELGATPVAGPPYVAVTSRGPILRATLDVGRLVIRFDAFAVERDPGPSYRRRSGVELAVLLE